MTVTCRACRLEVHRASAYAAAGPGGTVWFCADTEGCTERVRERLAGQ